VLFANQNDRLHSAPRVRAAIELVRQTPSGEVLRQLFPQLWNIWLYLWWKLDYLKL